MGCFLGCQNSKYFLGVLEIPDIFSGCTVDAGPEPTYGENIRVPPPPPPPPRDRVPTEFSLAISEVLRLHGVRNACTVLSRRPLCVDGVLTETQCRDLRSYCAQLGDLHVLGRRGIAVRTLLWCDRGFNY